MSAVPFGFAVRGCGCGCKEEGSSPGINGVAASASAGDDAVINALVGNVAVCAADAGVQDTSGNAAARKNHVVEGGAGLRSDDSLPDDVAAPRRAVDTEHSEGRIRQVRLAAALTMI